MCFVSDCSWIILLKYFKTETKYSKIEILISVFWKLFEQDFSRFNCQFSFYFRIHTPKTLILLTMFKVRFFWRLYSQINFIERVYLLHCVSTLENAGILLSESLWKKSCWEVFVRSSFAAVLSHNHNGCATNYKKEWIFCEKKWWDGGGLTYFMMMTHKKNRDVISQYPTIFLYSVDISFTKIFFQFWKLNQDVFLNERSVALMLCIQTCISENFIFWFKSWIHRDVIQFSRKFPSVKDAFC